MADPAPLRLGVIGLGAMGARIATRLVWQGFNPQVYDVVDIAVRMFTNDVGGMMSGSPKMMGQTSDVVITVLPSAEAMRDVLFGWEGLAGGLRSGGTIIDMGAADPLGTADLAKQLSERGLHLIDAPALGTPADARAGRLRLIVGGDEAAVERCRPVFAALSDHILRAGPAGSGHAGAALGDFLRGAEILAASEALRIGQQFGLDLKAVTEIGEASGGIGPRLGAMLREHVLTRRFETGLALGHVLRALEITTGIAQATAVHAPLAAACRAAWAAAEAEIGSGADQSELIRWLETATPPEPEAQA